MENSAKWHSPVAVAVWIMIMQKTFRI